MRRPCPGKAVDVLRGKMKAGSGKTPFFKILFSKFCREFSEECGNTKIIRKNTLFQSVVEKVTGRLLQPAIVAGGVSAQFVVKKFSFTKICHSYFVGNFLRSLEMPKLLEKIYDAEPRWSLEGCGPSSLSFRSIRG